MFNFLDIFFKKRMIFFRISVPKARKPEDFFSGMVGPGKMASGLRAFGLGPGPNTSLMRMRSAHEAKHVSRVVLARVLPRLQRVVRPQ